MSLNRAIKRGKAVVAFDNVHKVPYVQYKKGSAKYKRKMIDGNYVKVDEWGLAVKNQIPYGDVTKPLTKGIMGENKNERYIVNM